MNTLIIGASGKIGKSFINYKSKKFIFTYNSSKINQGIKFNIIYDNIEEIIKKNNINSVVIMSAISDPDYCKKYQKKSNLINVIKTKELINKLIKLKIYFIFFSTEFVYDGLKGYYSEKDKTNPISVYGKQKLKIENFIKRKTNNFAIFRIAKTYSDNMSDNTIISNFMKISKKKTEIYAATDQIFSPLYAKDIVRIVKYFSKEKIKGLFNVGGPEAYSRYSILKKFEKIFERKKIIIKAKIFKTSIDKFKFYELRAKNVSFNTSKIEKAINFKLSRIERILIKTLNEKFKRR